MYVAKYRIVLDDHLNKEQGSATSSYQDMIKSTFDLFSSNINKNKGGSIRDDVLKLKWEQKIKADADATTTKKSTHSY